MGRSIWVSIWVVVGGLTADGDAAAQASPAPGRAQDVEARPGGGFSFDLPIWQPDGHGAPVGLAASYSWSGHGVRKTAAARTTNDRGEDVWRLRFDDQPKPDEIARLELTYFFSLTEREKAAIREAAERVVVDLLEAIAATAGAADGFEKRASEKIGAVLQSDAAKKLAGYGDAGGTQNGLEILMARVGFAPVDSGGWSIGNRERLVAVARSFVEGRVAASAYERTIQQLRRDAIGAGEGRCASLDASAVLDAEKAQVVLEKCLPALIKDAETKAAEPGIRNDKTLAVELKEAIAILKRPPATQAEWDAALARLNDPRLTGYPLWAVRLASATKGRQAAEHAWTGVRDALVAQVSTAIVKTVRTEIGSMLVSGTERPRRYDISTGVIYAHELQDIIIPTFISICGWEGCLPPSSAAWTASNGWWRAASFDAGIRVETIDSQNVRQSDRISFAVGLSYNPVSVLRLSGGAYAFEDAQTQSWHVTPYFGITVNVLNAAKIFGQIGLGELKPDLGAVKH